PAEADDTEPCISPPSPHPTTHTHAHTHTHTPTYTLTHTRTLFTHPLTPHLSCLPCSLSLIHTPPHTPTHHCATHTHTHTDTHTNTHTHMHTHSHTQRNPQGRPGVGNRENRESSRWAASLLGRSRILFFDICHVSLSSLKVGYT